MTFDKKYCIIIIEKKNKQKLKLTKERHKKMKKDALDKINELIKQNYSDMQDVFVEYLDRVVDDSVSYKTLEKLRDIRDKLFDIRDILDEL